MSIQFLHSKKIAKVVGEKLDTFLHNLMSSEKTPLRASVKVGKIEYNGVVYHAYLVVDQQDHEKAKP